MNTENIERKKNTVKNSSHKSLRVRFWEQRYLWILLVPCILFYIIFCYAPLFGITIAFKRFNPVSGVFGSEWVGLTYFKMFLENPYLGRLIKNTFLLSFYSLVFGFPIPIIFALMLNELNNGAFKRIVQTVSYLPYFVSGVIVVGILRQLVAPDSGIINMILNHFGAEEINFFMEKQWFRTLYVSSSVWQNFGWNSIIYLSAISSIDPTLYEAATVDGAGRFKKILHITLPGIASTVIIILILNIGNLLNVGYEKVILMYNPNTYETADIISTYVYRAGLKEGNYSLGTAVGLLNSLVSLVFLSVANWLSKKTTGCSLW